MDTLPDDYFVTSQAFTKTTYRDVYPTIDPKSSSNSQAGKVIVITGASKGLGRRGFVPAFAHAGPRAIVIVARNAESLEVTAREIHAINSKIEVLAVPVDLKSATSVDALWEKVKARFGHADVLINNAGTFVSQHPIAESPITEWWSDFETNGRGTFLVTRGFLQLLGKERKGSIVNLTTGAAISIFPGLSGYSVSKLVALQLAAYVSAENTNVTAIGLHPGIVKTDMVVPAFEKFALDTPELVGSVGVWLSTDKASFLAGKYVSANWSVDELVERKNEIVTEGKLSVQLAGKFGEEQFK